MSYNSYSSSKASLLILPNTHRGLHDLTWVSQYTPSQHTQMGPIWDLSVHPELANTWDLVGNCLGCQVSPMWASPTISIYHVCTANPSRVKHWALSGHINEISDTGPFCVPRFTIAYRIDTPSRFSRHFVHMYRWLSVPLHHTCFVLWISNR